MSECVYRNSKVFMSSGSRQCIPAHDSTICNTAYKPANRSVESWLCRSQNFPKNILCLIQEQVYPIYRMSGPWKNPDPKTLNCTRANVTGYRIGGSFVTSSDSCTVGKLMNPEGKEEAENEPHGEIKRQTIQNGEFGVPAPPHTFWTKGLSCGA